MQNPVSLKKNIFANYVSQIYVTLISIALVPLYVQYMGAEAYGLVGFFAMLQAWFSLLDMGLTPTMARETARFKGGASDALGLRRLTRALEGIFFFVALLGGALLFLATDWIANQWLSINQLPKSEVINSLELISAIVALRWMSGLYRGVISGAERQVWLSGFNSIVATLRFVLVLPVMMFISAKPTVFFSFQLAAAVFEFSVLMLMAYRQLPTKPACQIVKWEWTPLKPVLKFSLTIAFTSSVWILVTQTDKLILSGILSLSEYGYFTLAVLAASGVMVINGPISSAITPYLARLHASSAIKEMSEVYLRTTRIVATFGIAVTLSMVFGSEQLIYAWSGNIDISNHSAKILTLYAAGNGFMILASFPYYLQYAHGNLRLHFIGNLIFASGLLPIIIFSAKHFGGIGAGYCWLTINALYFFFWVPIVHKKFFPKMHAYWMIHCIAKNVVPATLVCAAISLINFHSNSRIESLLYVTFLTISSLISMPDVMKMAFKYSGRTEK